MSIPDAAEFDSWYADMGLSSAKDEIQQRHLGLPPDLLSTSLLPWVGIPEVVDALALGPESVLLDLACGRGGYGLEIARRTGCSLVGVDFSAEAIRLARENAEQRREKADFRVGDLRATGLPDACVDAVLVVDAIQFVLPADEAYAEIHRVLKPNGRVVLTGWEVPDQDPFPDRLRAVDLAGGLAGAGFSAVEVQEKPAWRTLELAMWAEASELVPGDDPSTQAFQEEGAWVMSLPPGTRRVMGFGRR